MVSDVMKRDGLVLDLPRDANAFWGRVNKGPECWEYIGSRAKNGYGTSRTVGGYDYAHRISYRYAHGTIPEGLDLDHLCRNRACVRPDHLEPVTRRENAKRGAMSFAFTGRCISGKHEIEDDTSLALTNHGRTCRACRDDARAAHYDAIKQASRKLQIPVNEFIRTYGRSARKAREILHG